MSRPLLFSLVVVAILASGAFVARLPAQQVPMQTELLAEVRLLRQAIESLAGTNASVQIVFGRLQLQEQRTMSASQRLDQARQVLANVNRDVASLSDHAKDLEATLNDSRRRPDEIEQARTETVMIRRQIERLEVGRARAVADEADASSALNQEQGRWSDLNRQLEELERALAKQQ